MKSTHSTYLYNNSDGNWVVKTMSDQELNFVIHKKPDSITRPSTIQEGFTTISSKYFGEVDITRLLELLNTTNDVNMQIRVFSALSAHLMFNKSTDIGVLIKSNAVYDKIYSVLSQGLPRSSCEALNFLSSLLYEDSAEDCVRKLNLAAHARNMARLSGCLSAMCEMFTNCMMFHDTWKALCQCLALACSGCEINQSYCSHLIPVCIQKCCQENLDTLVVLQSLILNHTWNIELFQKCKGISIFTREILHYDKCLNLLTTLVKCSKTSIALLQHILPILQDFVRLYGSCSQLGQKAITILHHISKEAKGNGTVNNTTQTITHANDTEIETAKKVVENNNINANQETKFEETQLLMQNVMTEMYNWRQSELNSTNSNYKAFINENKMNIASRTLLKSNQNDKAFEPVNVTKNVNKTKNLKESKHRMRDSLNTELSFSFSQKNDFKIPYNKSPRFRSATQTKCKNEIKDLAGSRKYPIGVNRATELSFSYFGNEDFQIPVYRNAIKHSHRFYNDTLMNNTLRCETLSDVTKEENSTFEFRPIVASTPRHMSQNKNIIGTSVDYYKMQPEQNILKNLDKVNIESGKEIPSVNHIEVTSQSRNSQTQFKQKILKMKRQEAKRVQSECKKKNGNINWSLSARLFGAINDSCTTFVKTVKNIFNNKEISYRSHSTSSDDFTENTIINDRRPHHTYSFLNYMQKRDAVLDNNLTRGIGRSYISTDANSCKTCDDTIVMKNKLTRDEFLKQTVKKLKLGINLYGCNFKKISKTMWPRERYMTPLVLKKLYRKLLLK